MMDRSSPVVGDRSHTYDLLAVHLRSRPRATVIMWSVGAMCGLVGIAAAALPLIGGVSLAAGSILVAVVVGIILLRRATLATST
jgi:hypothetical protein